MIEKVTRLINAKPGLWALMLLAGLMAHVATDHWWQGLLIFGATLIESVAVDMGLFRAQKKAGELH